LASSFSLRAIRGRFPVGIGSGELAGGNDDHADPHESGYPSPEEVGQDSQMIRKGCHFVDVCSYQTCDVDGEVVVDDETKRGLRRGSRRDGMYGEKMKRLGWKTASETQEIRTSAGSASAFRHVEGPHIIVSCRTESEGAISMLGYCSWHRDQQQHLTHLAFNRELFQRAETWA
jgi:hypothetical protein